MVQNAAFKDGWHMSGGDTDWLGMDDGWRDKSAALQDATANSQSYENTARSLESAFPKSN